MGLHPLVRARDPVEEAFWFVKVNTVEFFPFAAVLTHCTEFPIAGEMCGLFFCTIFHKKPRLQLAK